MYSRAPSDAIFRIKNLSIAWLFIRKRLVLKLRNLVCTTCATFGRRVSVPQCAIYFSGKKQQKNIVPFFRGGRGSFWRLRWTPFGPLVKLTLSEIMKYVNHCAVLSPRINCLRSIVPSATALPASANGRFLCFGRICSPLFVQEAYRCSLQQALLASRSL